MVKLKYFKISEFDWQGANHKGKAYPAISARGKMEQAFLQMLDNARGIAGIPFIITSGYRPEVYDKDVHGITASDHSMGCGADIEVNPSDGRKAYLIIHGLITAGFTRIGFGRNGHIHVGGKNPFVPQRVFWIE